MNYLSGKVDFLLDNITSHQAAIIFIVLLLSFYSMYNIMKWIKECDNEPDIEEDEN